MSTDNPALRSAEEYLRWYADYCLDEGASAKDKLLGIASLIAAQRADPQAWQQIETAPKDGSRFQIPATDKGGGYYVATVCYIGGYDSGDIWFEALTGMNHHYPTAWMPLPAAPKPPEGE